MFAYLSRLIIVVAVVATITGCGGGTIPALKPLPAEAIALLAKKGMKEQSPIFIRVFKEESELEVWKEKDDGRYYHFKTYPICHWSGKLGPKLRKGDKQAPEGFYRVSQHQLNPNSRFHLSFNLGYPNAYDRAHGRTGAHLMVHGNCKSAGCYAMTDALMEEIYILAREAFIGGQDTFQVHAYPFRMTEANLKRHRKNKWHGFWRSLKEGYDHFNLTRLPVKVNVCEKRYLLNASFVNAKAKVKANEVCPAYQKLQPSIFAGAPQSLHADSLGTASITTVAQPVNNQTGTPTSARNH